LALGRTHSPHASVQPQKITSFLLATIRKPSTAFASSPCGCLIASCTIASGPAQLHQVFRKLGSFRGESAFTTWLHRLTVNQVLMHFRKKHVRKEQLTEDGEMPGGIMFARNRFNRPAVLDRLALDEAIVQLPHGYRTVFVLHDVEGLEHSEIASLLGCSIGTSKSQLHRARMRMRLLLKQRTVPR